MDSMNLVYHRCKLILLVASLTRVAAIAVRGSVLSPNDDLQLQLQFPDESRRHLLQESTCTLYRKCSMNAEGHHEDSWVCKLSQEDSESMNGVHFVDLVESEVIAIANANVTSGASTLTFSKAIIDASEPRMYIPPDAHVRVQDAGTSGRSSFKNGINNAKIGPGKKGTLTALVLRVIDRNGRAPTADTAKLENDIFEDSVSLKSQIEACSYNKLNIEPFRGSTPTGKYINNGVVDVTIDHDIASNLSNIDSRVKIASDIQLGDLDDPMFDLVLVCYPATPLEPKYFAYAIPNTKFSYYHDGWCEASKMLLHEVGHNIGLAHSGKLGEVEYGDGTGAMGGSSSKNDDTSICYNPQKSYQLGWYEDQTDSIDPLDGSLPLEFTLNGVSDYGKNSDALIVLRLVQTDQVPDYYIGYNRATGIHSDTAEDRDRVTIVRKEWGTPDVYARSLKTAALGPGQRTLIQNFNGSGRDIQVKYTAVNDNGDIQIMILEGIEPPPEPPGSCQNFIVEVVTDDYPEDNSWYVVDTDEWARVGAVSEFFNEKRKEYRQEICLPRGPNKKTYKFAFEDSYGDGMQHGIQGGYEVFNENGQLLFSGGNENKKWNYHNFEIDSDPNAPPTASPTMRPSQPNSMPPCRDYIVEVKTDSYPEDTFWKFVRINSLGNETADEERLDYDQKSAVHTDEVCLYEGFDYTFKFSDRYGDGIGEGYYKVMDKCSGDVVVDRGMKPGNFTEESYPISIPTSSACAPPNQSPVQPSPTESPVQPSPTESPVQPSPTGSCINIVKNQFKTSKKAKKRKCKAHAKKKECDTIITGGVNEGKLVKSLCKKACKACDE